MKTLLAILFAIVVYATTIQCERVNYGLDFGDWRENRCRTIEDGVELDQRLYLLEWKTPFYERTVYLGQCRKP